MSAPRIDTFRNLSLHIVDLLGELGPDIEDVHDLAYNRNRAAGEAKVAGGSRDYALDSHGDMIARELYIDVAAQLVGLGRGAEKALRKLRKHLNREDTALRRDESANVSAAEFDQARYAQARRNLRGERSPHAHFAQPDRKNHIDPVMELLALQAAVRRLAAHMDREHKGCRDDDGKRKPKWLDRSILSPAQRDALDRSLIDPNEAAAS